MSDIQAPDQCDLFGYDFCLVCGKVCPEEFLKLFLGLCSDCLATNTIHNMRRVVVDVDRTYNEETDAWRAAKTLKAEYEARYGTEVTYKSEWSERQVLGALQRHFPNEYLAAKAIVRMRHGSLPFTHADLHKGRCGPAIETVRNWLRYDSEHADSAEDPQTDRDFE